MDLRSIGDRRTLVLFVGSLLVGVVGMVLLLAVSAGTGPDGPVSTGTSLNPAERVHDAVPDRLYCDWFGNTSPPRLRAGMSCRSNLYPGYSNVTFVETDQHGFRYGPLAGEAGDEHIAVLGGGVAMGLGVPAQQAFPAVLDDRLPDATVLMASAPWYGIEDSFRMAETLMNTTAVDRFMLPLGPRDTVGAAEYQGYLREAAERYPDGVEEDYRRIADVRVHEHVEALPDRIEAGNSTLQRYLERFRELERRTGVPVIVFSPTDSRHVPGLVRAAGLRYLGQPLALEGAYMDHRLAPEEPYLDAGGHRIVAEFLAERLAGTAVNGTVQEQ